MELRCSQSQNRDGLLGPKSITVVHMDPLGLGPRVHATVDDINPALPMIRIIPIIPIV